MTGPTPDGMRGQPPERRRATAWAWPSDGGGRADGSYAPGLTAAVPAGQGPAMPGLAAGRLYRAVSGVDGEARPMTDAERADLHDPLAAVFFRHGRFPMSSRELLAGLDGAGAVPEQSVFLVSESGQLPPSAAPGLHRDIRYAITRAERGRIPDLLISTGANSDPDTTFLQVAAWDAQAGHFNYYMRIRPAWVWTGDSWSALAPASRGHGCFDSHVNGSVVMKELKQPWINWQSMAATIRLAPDDPLRGDPLYGQVAGAEQLETTVKALVGRWTDARLAKVTARGTVDRPDHLLRQLFTSTTVNLTSTSVQSATVRADGDDLVLPIGFWLNGDALLDDLGLPVAAAPPRVPAALYLDSLSRFGFRMQERTSGFSQPGDTFFAFLVPEAAREDNDVVHRMVLAGILPAKFAAAALMVDFPNPVYSTDRARLMAYVPTTPTPAAALADSVADAITTAARGLPQDSPEARFAGHWALADDAWPTAFAARVDAYLGRVAARTGTPEGFDDLTRLAESRRRDFRSRKLNEFELTLPVTGIPADAPRLRMNEDATVTATAPAPVTQGATS
ncbi:hypothetical protein ABZ419_09440 [Streptomyces cinnamoneus]|uniref:hypothetical protein n=1 Tax=Streptomyces cinnamoneus TaxID=53446 RepID=UPI0033D5F169